MFGVSRILPAQRATVNSIRCDTCYLHLLISDCLAACATRFQGRRLVNTTEEKITKESKNQHGDNPRIEARHIGRRISDVAVCGAAEHSPTYIEFDMVERQHSNTVASMVIVLTHPIASRGLYFISWILRARYYEFKDVAGGIFRGANHTSPRQLDRYSPGISRRCRGRYARTTADGKLVPYFSRCALWAFERGPRRLMNNVLVCLIS